jgi:hypothetical protein
MEMDRDVLPSTPRIWKDLEGNRLKDIGSLLWRIKMISPPCVRPRTIPLFFQDLPIPKGQKGEEIISQADV